MQIGGIRAVPVRGIMAPSCKRLAPYLLLQLLVLLLQLDGIILRLLVAVVVRESREDV